ncbi:MAG: bifunctional (p)ppGpp synthetase/guanosine-3',5'-bis(diphosphate) 3'-pyrophosphohydrolase [Caldisericia bacterium]|nr:bifunctional (p)ppGpp synthetase/guanosine-3',5'-bis(diphosphate) 3'-pyrophosphohydrolase [Caldisericia bacterium]
MTSTESVSKEQLLASLISKASYAQDTENLIGKAYEIADKMHAGQLRQSGEEYITHPMNVALILTELHADLPSLVAAILHDTLEDTALTPESVKEKFGPEVLQLVLGVTKLNKLQFKSSKEQQLENTRKMLLAMANDIRVVLIKLADRLHNMRSLSIFRRDKQVRIAQETMEIFVPLAGRLGIYRIKWELEDLAFRAIEPEEFKELADKVAMKRSEREMLVDQTISEISELLKSDNVHFEISGRAKNLYSIYKKMDKDDKDVDEIFDLHAVRVLVEDIPTCYKVLGFVHTQWKPLPGRIKDYIAVPKSNGYKSLHTTVIGPRGFPVEIQIRTYEMHADAEYGIAAHWKYKEKNKVDANDETKLSWLRQLLEWQKEIKPTEEFVEQVKTDLFSDEVLVFTPKGDIINLPVGATPIDFAYRIHTDVGNSCTGAKVNGKIVQLSYKLVTGDRVQVMTSKHVEGPSRDWLKTVAANSTKEKIRNWFRKKAEEENPKDDEEEEVKPKPQAPQRRPSRVGKAGAMVLLKGIDNAPVILARCCNPIVGDPIVGFVTRGRGVSIHRTNCPNFANLKAEAERVIEAEWITDSKKTFIVGINILVENKPGVLAKLSGIISETGVNINMAKAVPVDISKSRIIFSVEVLSIKELNDLIVLLERVPEVKKVARQ